MHQGITCLDVLIKLYFSSVDYLGLLDTTNIKVQNQQNNGAKIPAVIPDKIKTGK